MPTMTMKVKPEPKVESVAVAVLSAELQLLQRERRSALRARNMYQNALRHHVATSLDYSSGLDEKERQAKFVEAQKHIDAVVKNGGDDRLAAYIKMAMIGIGAAAKYVETVEKAMEKIAARLPVAAWVADGQQRGFGNLSLAKIVGETGDLANYPNPAKVWRRMGCAPWQFDGKTLMGSTWRFGQEGKLPASEWEEFGYCKRRRSVVHVVSECLLKLNGDGPYRRRYDDTKAVYIQKHEGLDLKCADKECGKAFKEGERVCPKCGGEKATCMRAHMHGMLLAGKLLLKNLWIEWRR